MRQQKVEIREKYLNIRKQLDPLFVHKASQTISQKLLELANVKKAKTILIYASVKNEVETAPLIQTLLDQGKTVALPYVESMSSGKMQAIRIDSLADVEAENVPGLYHLLQPRFREEKVITPDKIDLIIVPGVSFDRKGTRLGHGGGFYDKFLAETENVSIIALAFGVQISKAMLPLESHDIQMDYIITEESSTWYNLHEKIIKCKN